MLRRSCRELKAHWRNCLNKFSILFFAACDTHAVLCTVADGRVEECIVIEFRYSNCKECSPATLARRAPVLPPPTIKPRMPASACKKLLPSAPTKAPVDYFKAEEPQRPPWQEH